MGRDVTGLGTGLKSLTDVAKFVTHPLLAPPFKDFITVEIPHHGDTLDVDACGRAAMMIECFLRGPDVACHLRDNAREGVVGTAQVEAFHPGFFGVLLPS